MNNLLLTIFYSFIVFLSQIVIFYIFNQFSKEPIKMKKILIPIIILASIVEILLTRYVTPILNCVCCLIYFLAIVRIFTTLKWSDIIFYNIIIWILMLLMDMMIMLIFNFINLFCPQINKNMLIAKPIGTIIMDVVLLGLTKLKFISKFVNKLYVYIHKLNLSYIYMLGIFFLYFLLDSLIFINLENRSVIETTILLSILIGFTIIKFLKNGYEISTLKETNSLLIKNNDFYIKLLNDYRILKHNLTSKLLGIKSISNNKAKDLINDLIKEYNATFQTTHDLKDVPSGLNGIIYEKVYNFNKKDLNVLVNNKLKNNLLNIISSRSYNLLCEALGVILDNALEAAYNSQDKVIYIQFLESENDINVIIKNTFEGFIDIEKIGSINYTTKKEGHGLGLYSLIGRKKIKLKTYIKNNLYTTVITIEKK